MKRTINFLVSLALIVGMAQMAQARITASTGERDAWAVGAPGYEVAIDSSGNIVPTYNASQSLGDRAHLWQGIYVSSLVVISSITIPDNSIGTSKLISGVSTAGLLSIDSTKIAALAVDSEKLAKNSVDTEKVNADSIITTKILNLNVTTAKIAALAVDSTKLAAASVDSEKLIERSITGAKLVNLTVDSTKIGALSVDSEKIVKSAVNTEKVAAGVINTSKLGFLNIGSVNSGKVVCIAGGNTQRVGIATHCTLGAAGALDCDCE